jgi:Fe-S-cluster containining protein
MERIEIPTEIRVPVTIAMWLHGIKENYGQDAFETASNKYYVCYQHYKNQLEKITNSMERVVSIHQGIDGLMEYHIKKESLKATCRRGCAECCRMFVFASPSEAKFLLRAAKERGMTIDWDRVQKQAGRGEEDFYTSILGEDNKCVFLDENNSCKLYKMRPSSCRTHYVASKKELCIMDVKNKVQKILNPEAEALVHAYIATEGCENVGLADMLLKVRGEV